MALPSLVLAACLLLCLAVPRALALWPEKSPSPLFVVGLACMVEKRLSGLAAPSEPTALPLEYPEVLWLASKTVRCALCTTPYSV